MGKRIAAETFPKSYFEEPLVKFPKIVRCRSNEAIPISTRKRGFNDSKTEEPCSKRPKIYCFTEDTAKNLIHGTEKSKDLLADCYETEIIYRSKENISNVVIPEKEAKDSNACFICSQTDDLKDLIKCYENKCQKKAHKECIEKMNFGGYTVFHASTNRGFQCPSHHCQKCFADGLHQRCFQFKELISCKLCNINFHSTCIPAGCVISKKKTIICPRHVIVTKFRHRPTNYCFECCEKKSSEEPLINCSNCVRSFHQKCHSYYFYQPENSKGERCSYCIKSNFVKNGEYVYAQYKSFEYHLGIVIPNDEYPDEKARKKIPIGSYCIRWIEDLNRCSIVSHYRTYPFNEYIWFHVNRQRYPLLKKIKDYGAIVERIKAEYLTIKPPPKEQTSSKFIRNNIIRNIKTNKFQREEFRNACLNKDADIDMCYCNGNKENRCAGDSCVNRHLRQECPKECERKRGNCQNRLISKKMNLFENLEIFYTEDRGYGIRAKMDIPKNSYIGEYCGEVISKKEKKNRDKINKIWGSRDVSFYAMAFNGFFIDAGLNGSIMRYANHSCAPNCISQIYTDSDLLEHVCIFARKNIVAGEEITYSYSSNHHKNGLSFTCFCGAASCKGAFNA